MADPVHPTLVKTCALEEAERPLEFLHFYQQQPQFSSQLGNLTLQHLLSHSKPLLSKEGPRAGSGSLAPCQGPLAHVGPSPGWMAVEGSRPGYWKKGSGKFHHSQRDGERESPFFSIY